MQANISSEDALTFIFEGYKTLLQHITSGNALGVGIFEGVPIDIEAVNKDGQRSVFEGFVDLASGAEIDTEIAKITAPLKRKNGLNTLSDRLDALDFEQLYSEGIIKDSDFVPVEYVVNPPNAVQEGFILSIMLFSLVNQLLNLVEKQTDTAATTSGIAASGVTGPAGAGIYGVIKIAGLVAQAVALAASIVKLSRDFVRIFAPPVRTHKGILLKTLIQKACTKLGYGFETSATLLNKVVYLPSNLNVDRSVASTVIDRPGVIEKGIPNITDYGFSCQQAFELAALLVNGRYALVNGTVQLHSELATYWQKQSTYTMPDIAPVPFMYNTNELNGRFVVSFLTDISDSYTIDNFTGTAYEVVTQAANISNAEAVNIKGVEEITIPVALGNRKDKASAIELAAKALASVIDDVTGALATITFGAVGRANLADQIRTRVGVLQVSDNNHAVPKLLYLEGGRLPENHRDLLSAKALYNSYYFERSFVSNNRRRQRKLYKGVRVPFGFVDFIKTTDNNYFTTAAGESGRIERIEWLLSEDYAIFDYYIEEPYTNNLNESFIEP